ncbi:hypothetical protein HZA26_00200, partial [Candidatus Nomurabacteria bacterium]|nr:hypothetical protein [Candidatus Nomurabacteria bacterium]
MFQTSLLIRKFLEKGTPSINTKVEVTRCEEEIISDAALQTESEKDIVLRAEISVQLENYLPSPPPRSPIANEYTNS